MSNFKFSPPKYYVIYWEAVGRGMVRVAVECSTREDAQDAALRISQRGEHLVCVTEEVGKDAPPSNVAAAPLARAQEAVRESGHLWCEAEEGSRTHREMVVAQALAAVAQAESLTRLADVAETWLDMQSRPTAQPSMTPAEIETVKAALRAGCRTRTPDEV